MRRSLLHQVYPAYLVVIVAALATLSFTADRIFRTALYGEKERELETIATLARNSLGAAEFDHYAFEWFRRDIQERITIIAPDGTVVAESHHDRERMVNHGDRPEVHRAIRGEKGVAVRRSETTGKKTLYVAIPYPVAWETHHDGRGYPLHGAVRAATSVEPLDHVAREILAALIAAAALILLTTAITAVVVIRRIHRPLKTIQDGAHRYYQGDLGHRIDVSGPEEITEVAATLNSMAEELARTIGNIQDQRNELEAVLAGMVEGVIVVDAERRIHSMNAAAQRFFGRDGLDYRGRSLIDHLRNSDLDSFTGLVLEKGTYEERTITLYRPAPVYIQVHGTLLHRSDETNSGVLLVLNDITRLKRLEEVRRDFVANVSHELKTPVTAILGFVETLRDGLPPDPGQTERFLDIISVNANRLNLIIEDLLTLSRLESTESGFTMETCNLESIVRRVLQSCTDQAGRKNIEMRYYLHGAATARANENLLEQALSNLVNNAIKYSSDGDTVEVTVANDPAQVVLEVRDTGQGIPAGDVPRIFERFFRVDRARSRELGGTGLGLAIVKHIAMAHNGEVTVDSAEGVGSTFRLVIPQRTTL